MASRVAGSGHFHALLIATVAAAFAIYPGLAQTRSINFDDGSDLQVIGDFYVSLGVVFPGIVWYEDTRIGSTPPFMIAGEGETPPYPVYLTPTYDNPLVVLFTTPLIAASIMGLDVGDAGCRIDAIDAGGSVIAYDEAWGEGDGDGQYFTLSVSSGAGICSIHMYQPTPVSYDGLFWDNMTFTLARGDLNCDGAVDFGDINPFVLYLSNFAAWQATYTGCPPSNGDINEDGEYPSFGDINPFVALLAGG